MADRYKIATNLVAEGVAVPELVKKKVPPAGAALRGGASPGDALNAPDNALTHSQEKRPRTL